MLGRGEDAFDLHRIGGRIGGRPRPVDGEITRRFRPQRRRARFERVARIDDGRQFFVVDGYEFRGVLRDHRALGNHHGDGLADMHHAVGRECRAMRYREFCAVAAGQRRMPRNIADAFNVLGRKHGYDARRGYGGADVDAFDVREGMRRAHEKSESLVRQRRVGHVAAMTAHQCVVFDARVALRMLIGLGVGFGVHAASA